jgi:dihydroorotase
MGIILKGGQAHSGNSFITADVLIKNGIIEKIAPNINAEGQIVDCTGKYIIPGLIDAHVHFREPGLTHKEDFLTGSKAAAAGGVTTILEMPNTKPPVVTQKDLDEKRKLAQKSLVNYGIYVLGCKENMKEIGNFEGIPGIKIYLGSSTGNYLTDDLGVFIELLKNAKQTVVVHAENEQLVKYFSEQHKATEMHHKMRDNLCAVTSVAESSIAANYYGKKMHIAHMSTKEEVDFLRKNKTPNISCEVCPHHLFLNESFFVQKKNFGKMNPPLRYERDQKALWEAIKEGIIDIVATDHAPHTLEEKHEDFWKGPCGVPGVQTMLPLLLNSVSEGKISLVDVVRLCSTNPARIFNIQKRGKLEAGYHADICIVDMNKEKTITNSEQHSKCGWTPFDGMKIKGWPVMTLVNGNIVYDGKINEAHKGREVEVN